MGKKSLTKSTTKKKTATKKKAAAKKTEAKAAPKKKATAKAKAAPKKATAKKKPAAKKKPTLKSLLKKDFGSWSPENLFAVMPDEDYLKNFTAPPAIEETDKAKAKAIKTLLTKQFDLTAIKKPAKAKKAAPKKTEAKKSGAKKAKPAPKKKATPAKKKALSVPELLKLKFESWQPEKMYEAVTDDEFQKGFTAPPSIDTGDKAEADRIKTLLLKTMDLKVSKAEREAAEKAIAEAEAKAKAKAEKEAAEKAKKEAEAKAKAEAEAKAKAEKEAKAKAEKEAEEKTKAEAKAKAKAEKEAAEKAKAEAEAAEKAMKEAEAKAKAEAEAKAKAEKKAKAETEAKAKAEKQAAEKARADAAAKWRAENPPEPPMNSAVKMLIAIIGGLFGLLLIGSAMNTNNYYLTPSDNAVEIWQGKFSPTGKKLVMSVPGATVKEPVKSVYAKKEALVPAYNYYIAKAEALSKNRDVLDFKTIKSDLYKAIKFAPTIHDKKEAKARLNNIDFMFLIYKADAAAGKKTVKGCEAALKNLSKAAAYGPDKEQRELLNKKTAEINKQLSAIKDKIKALKPRAITEKVSEHKASKHH